MGSIAGLPATEAALTAVVNACCARVVKFERSMRTPLLMLAYTLVNIKKVESIPINLKFLCALQHTQRFVHRNVFETLGERARHLHLTRNSA